MGLAVKYRPKSFEEFVGNKKTVLSLRKVLQREDRPHGFLFIGPAGCGKTTLARLVAKELGCSGIDLHEMNSADYRGIDTVRELSGDIRFSPMVSPVSVWILDEFHQQTRDAQEAFLKILEEPPAHVYFILCTTEPSKLKPTIKSRCVTYQVGPLDWSELERLLRWVVESEGAKVSEELIEDIIGASNGYPRDALQMLEQVISLSEDEADEVIRAMEEERTEAVHLCRALMKGVEWDGMVKIINRLGALEVEQIRRMVRGYMVAVLRKGGDADIPIRVLRAFGRPFYDQGDLFSAVYDCLEEV